MVDEKRLKAMIDLAMYEQGEGKEDLEISRFYSRDYISLGLLKNIVLITIAYIAVAAFVVVGNFENFAANISDMNVQPMLVGVLICYLMVVGFFSVIVVVTRRIKYRNAVTRVKKYYKKLRELNDIYKEEALIKGTGKENTEK